MADDGSVRGLMTRGMLVDVRGCCLLSRVFSALFFLHIIFLALMGGCQSMHDAQKKKEGRAGVPTQRQSIIMLCHVSRLHNFYAL